MMKTSALGLALAFGLATAANAMGVPITMGGNDGSIIKVGEGCGAGAWRGPNGVCHPFGGPGGNNRGTRYECPPGMHIGPGGEKCWPNR